MGVAHATQRADLNRPRPSQALALLWPGAFAFFLSFYLLLSALPLYARDVGVSDRAIGLIIGCFAFASMLVKPWAGWAADRFGRRPLMLAGAAIFLTAALAYAGSVTTLALLGVRLLHGCGMGLYPTAASAVVADLAPPERRGELLGLFGSSANVAMAVGPIAGMALADHLGWVSLFMGAAATALVALVLALAAPETLREPSRQPFHPSTTVSREALLPSLVVLCMMLTYGAQVSFLPLYAVEQGVNAGLFFLVFALVVAIVRSHAGRLSDRLGRVPVAVAGLALAAAALILQALGRGAVGFTVAGAIYGIGFGTAQPAVMAWCVDGVKPEHRGRAMGTYYTALELGIAGGALAAGLAVAAFGFTATFLAVAAAALVGAAIALAVGRPRRPRPFPLG